MRPPVVKVSEVDRCVPERIGVGNAFFKGLGRLRIRQSVQSSLNFAAQKRVDLVLRVKVKQLIVHKLRIQQHVTRPGEIDQVTFDPIGLLAAQYLDVIVTFALTANIIKISIGQVRIGADRQLRRERTWGGWSGGRPRWVALLRASINRRAMVRHVIHAIWICCELSFFGVDVDKLV